MTAIEELDQENENLRKENEQLRSLVNILNEFKTNRSK